MHQVVQHCAITFCCCCYVQCAVCIFVVVALFHNGGRFSMFFIIRSTVVSIFPRFLNAFIIMSNEICNFVKHAHFHANYRAHSTIPNEHFHTIGFFFIYSLLLIRSCQWEKSVGFNEVKKKLFLFIRKMPSFPQYSLDLLGLLIDSSIAVFLKCLLSTPNSVERKKKEKMKKEQFNWFCISKTIHKKPFAIDKMPLI